MKKKKNDITFIIATKNNISKLYKTVSSIERTFKGVNYNIIIKDNGSLPKNKKSIKKIKNVTHFFSNKDKSIYEAWNYSMQFVKTKYVSFLGVEDKINKNYINFLYYCHLNRNTDFFYCKARLIGTNKTIGAKTNKLFWPFVMPIVHVGGIFKTNFLKKYNYNKNLKISGDYDVFIRTNKKIKILFYNKICVFMKVGGISQDPKKDNLRILEMFKSIKKNYNIVFAILYFLINLVISFLKK